MNILPKKRWHVRTKENIARVRKDEAQAAEEAKERERKIKLAEKEARIELLRVRSRSQFGKVEAGDASVDLQDDNVTACSTSSLSHVNLFADEEAGLSSGTAVNKEHEEEKKQEIEKYEKQIGYLTYLGQDTNEATGKVSWYNRSAERMEPGLAPKEEIGLKHKILSDPLNSFKAMFSCNSSKRALCKADSSSKTAPISDKKISDAWNTKKKCPNSPEPLPSKKRKDRKKEKKHRYKKKSKHKRQKGRESESSLSDINYESDTDEVEKKKKLEKLRAERLQREKEEKKKAEKLLAKINGVAYIDEEVKKPEPPMKQKYNSQFNPFLAKQNYDDQRYRFSV